MKVKGVCVFTMAANPEIQMISANVEDYVNEVHICQTSADSKVAANELGRGFCLVAPAGSIDNPLMHHTQWLHFNETTEGFRDALTELFPEGF